MKQELSAAASGVRGEVMASSLPHHDSSSCIFVFPSRQEGGSNFCDPGSLVPWHTASKQPNTSKYLLIIQHTY